MGPTIRGPTGAPGGSGFFLNATFRPCGLSLLSSSSTSIFLHPAQRLDAWGLSSTTYHNWLMVSWSVRLSGLTLLEPTSWMASWLRSSLPGDASCCACCLDRGIGGIGGIGPRSTRSTPATQCHNACQGETFLFNFTNVRQLSLQRGEKKTKKRQ